MSYIIYEPKTGLRAITVLSTKLVDGEYIQTPAGLIHRAYIFKSEAREALETHITRMAEIAALESAEFSNLMQIRRTFGI